MRNVEIQQIQVTEKKGAQEQLIQAMKSSISAAKTYISGGYKNEPSWSFQNTLNDYKSASEDAKKSDSDELFEKAEATKVEADNALKDLQEKCTRQRYLHSLQIEKFNEFCDTIIGGKGVSHNDTKDSSLYSGALYDKAFKSEFASVPAFENKTLLDNIEALEKKIEKAEEPAKKIDDQAQKTLEKNRAEVQAILENPNALLKEPFTKGHAEFFRAFYKEVTKLYERSNGQERASTEKPIVISILGLNKDEYHNFVEALKKSRDSLELFPAGTKITEEIAGTDETKETEITDNIMDFTRSNDGKSVTINFKNVERETLKPDETLAASVLGIMLAHNLERSK